MSASRFSEVMDKLEPGNPLNLESLPEEELLNAFDEELCESLHNFILGKFLGVNPEEKTPFSYLMQKNEKEIKKLPQKTREKLCKKYVETMKNERDMMGWPDIHEELEDTTISDAQDQIIADYSCMECGMGVFRGYSPAYYPLCYLCKLVEVEMTAQHAEEECKGCFWCSHD